MRIHFIRVHPTYDQKPPNSDNNDNGDYNWLFGIK